jgi:hypothetical protein
MEAYVGIKNGSIRAVVVDDPKDTELTAEMLSDWIKMGRTVERMRLDDAIARMKAKRSRAFGIISSQ